MEDSIKSIFSKIREICGFVEVLQRAPTMTWRRFDGIFKPTRPHLLYHTLSTRWVCLVVGERPDLKRSWPLHSFAVASTRTQQQPQQPAAARRKKGSAAVTTATSWANVRCNDNNSCRKEQPVFLVDMRGGGGLSQCCPLKMSLFFHLSFPPTFRLLRRRQIVAQKKEKNVTTFFQWSFFLACFFAKTKTGLK